MNNKKNVKQFVIIGAGPTGLTAAYQILREIPCSKVDVYEAEERPGGISTTIEHNGTVHEARKASLSPLRR
jgi:protoporphyrinogen oxidase